MCNEHVYPSLLRLCVSFIHCYVQCACVFLCSIVTWKTFPSPQDQEQNEDEEDGYVHTDLFQRDQSRQSNIAAKGTESETDLFFPPLNPSNLDLHLREGTSADHELAQRLREDERSQLEYDAQLAAQLQMRENAYLRPLYVYTVYTQGQST